MTRFINKKGDRLITDRLINLLVMVDLWCGARGDSRAFFMHCKNCKKSPFLCTPETPETLGKALAHP